MIGEDGSYIGRTEVTLGAFPEEDGNEILWSGTDTEVGSMPTLRLDRDREVTLVMQDYAVSPTATPASLPTVSLTPGAGAPTATLTPTPTPLPTPTNTPGPSPTPLPTATPTPTSPPGSTATPTPLPTATPTPMPMPTPTAALGGRTILANFGAIPTSGLGNFYDSENERVFASQNNGSGGRDLIAVDLATGSTTTITTLYDGGGGEYGFPSISLAGCKEVSGELYGTQSDSPSDNNRYLISIDLP